MCGYFVNIQTVLLKTYSWSKTYCVQLNNLCWPKTKGTLRYLCPSDKKRNRFTRSNETRVCRKEKLHHLSTHCSFLFFFTTAELIDLRFTVNNAVLFARPRCLHSIVGFRLQMFNFLPSPPPTATVIAIRVLVT